MVTAITTIKNPEAPKRFMSSYMHFYVDYYHKNKNEKKEQQREESAPHGEDKDGRRYAIINISREATEKWKTLSPREREYWDVKSNEDRLRFIEEKANYDGPLYVIKKKEKKKKDPTAPKRSPSAFLVFSKVRRKELRKMHPKISNSEISVMLGQEWRNKSPEEKKPHIDQELILRAKYYDDMSKWREMKDSRPEQVLSSPGDASDSMKS